MFFYFYDTFVLDKKHEGTLTRVENRIIELGINGRVEKLTPLRNMKELLEDGIKQGAHTVVIIGDDATLVRAINIIAPHDIVLGYIPFGKTSILAELFGIPDTFEACNILSRRIIKQLNLGKANANYFLTSLVSEVSNQLKITCDGQFTVSSRSEPIRFHIHNLGNVFATTEPQSLYTNATRLHLEIEPIPNGRSLFKRTSTRPSGSTFPIRKAEITHTNEAVPVRLDNETTIKTPITVTFKAKQLKVVVGKDRRIS